MKVGLIGNGGREHALAKGLCLNPHIELFVTAKNQNDGIHQLAEDYIITGFNDPQKISNYFQSKKVDLVVVGPEATLMLGIVDLLRKENILVVGPTRAQALLEGDKSFMRELLRDKLGWGSPGWKTVGSVKEAKAFIEDVGDIVVKPIGLTGGRGVRVMGIQLVGIKEALSYVGELLENDDQVLLEERIVGEEFSRMAFVSDGVLGPMPLFQDFKYAYDGDQGLMTGGMGVYSFSDGRMPFITTQEIADADRLLSEVVSALEEKTAQPYRGFLYGQFMASAKGIRLIEFNVRLGDPEALNAMSLLKSDPTDLCAKVASGTLKNSDVIFDKKASCSKYLVPNEYPDPLRRILEFEFDENLVEDFGFSLVQASVERVDNQYWRALGSRTLGIVGLGDTPEDVSDRIEDFLASIHLPDLRHRKDVGNREIIRGKIEKMEQIRAGK